MVCTQSASIVSLYVLQSHHRQAPQTPKCVRRIFQVGFVSLFAFAFLDLAWIGISTCMDLYQTFIIREGWLGLWGCGRWAGLVVIWRSPNLPAGGRLPSGGPQHRDIYTYASICMWAYICNYGVNTQAKSPATGRVMNFKLPCELHHIKKKTPSLLRSNPELQQSSRWWYQLAFRLPNGMEISNETAALGRGWGPQ